MLTWKFRKIFNFLHFRKLKYAAKIATELPIFQITQNKKILFIAPHPDDETIAAGGLLWSAVKKENKIFIILISAGEKWGPKDSRLREFNSSLKILGIKPSNILFLGLPDRFSRTALNRVKIYRALHQAMKKIKPDLLIYPSELDLEKDHKVIGQIINHFKKDDCIFLSYLIHYVAFPKPYRFRPNEFLLPPTKLLKQAKWLIFPLTDEIIEKKHEAILNYRTQLSVPGMRQLLLSFVRKNEIFIKT